MLVEIIKGKEIVNKINTLLSKQADEKIVVFGTIDDEGYNAFEQCIASSRAKIFLSVSRKCTTKSLLDKIIKIGNVFVHNNNDNMNIQTANLIITKQGKVIEVIISTFDFFGNTIDNTNDIALQLSDENDELRELYEIYALGTTYVSLSEELIEKLDKDKQLRNDKAATLTNVLNKDEVIKSFRSIGQVENKDEYLKMLQIKNDIRRSKLGATEVFYADDEVEVNSEDASIDSIEIDIEI